MTDQWELDTLSILNEKRAIEGLTPFLWNDELWVASEMSMSCIDAWERIDEIPPQITLLLVRTDETHEDDSGHGLTYHTTIWQDYGYEYQETRGLAYDPLLFGMGDFYRPTYLRRPLIPKYLSIPLWDRPGCISANVICGCQCPHYTAPRKIAELLWCDKIKCNEAKYASIRIKNDDKFTYVILACK